MESDPNPRRSSIAPAIALFFLAPLIGEFLLGNIAIDAIFFIVVAAPLYGGGALLIREVARRTGRGWPTIALLAVAYALIEEGLVDQMFFNPAYDGLGMLDKAYIPAWGTGAWVILASISVHAIWSVCVSIALVEALTPQRSTTPWLGRPGLMICAVVYVAGAAYVAYAHYQEYRFVASATQLTVTAVATVALVVLAFAFGRRARQPIGSAASSPWMVGLLSLAASSLLMVILDYLPPWIAVACWIVLVAAAVSWMMLASRRQDWGAAHRLALAGGALLTYVWIGFPQVPSFGSRGIIDLIGNAIFGAGALILLAAAMRSVRGTREAS
jgi:hypothetical protein